MTNSLQAELESEVAAHERDAIARASLQVCAVCSHHGSASTQHLHADDEAPIFPSLLRVHAFLG